MTIANFIEWANHHPVPIIVYMAIVPAAAFVVSLVLDELADHKPFVYVYSILMYATCVPGVLAIVLTGYSVVLQRDDILRVNVMVYFLPIISMLISIAVINRVVRMSDIPGFKRLSGFMIMIGATFVLVFILQRMFIGVVFFGTLQSLLLLFVVLFAAIKFAWDRLT